RIGEPSRPAMFARMWRLIATISNGDHRAALADLAAQCEGEGDPHHRIPLHQAIARWHSRLDGAASADEVDAPIAARRGGMAETTLRDAAAVAEETGAATERAHIDQLLRQLGIRTWRRGARRRASGDLFGLSEREREIANLIAGGASNPDIAGTLFLSRKTVERHVSSILGKLEVKNRAQLAARMAAGDWLASTDRRT